MTDNFYIEEKLNNFWYDLQEIKRKHKKVNHDYMTEEFRVEQLQEADETLQELERSLLALERIFGYGDQIFTDEEREEYSEEGQENDYEEL